MSKKSRRPGRAARTGRGHANVKTSAELVATHGPTADDFDQVADRIEVAGGEPDVVEAIRYGSQTVRLLDAAEPGFDIIGGDAPTDALAIRINLDRLYRMAVDELPALEAS